MQSFVKSDVFVRQWPAVGQRRGLPVRGTGYEPIDLLLVLSAIEYSPP